MNSYKKYFLIYHNFKLITSINQYKDHNKPVHLHTQVRIQLLYIFFFMERLFTLLEKQDT